MSKLIVHSNKSNQFTMAIRHILDEYDSQVATVVRLAVEETAQHSVEQLKQRGDFKGRKYKNSWTVQMEQRSATTMATVHNKKEYRLSHLLEFGHVKQNGGRTRAFPHIEPVSIEAQRMFEERIRANISGIESIYSKGGM